MFGFGKSKAQKGETQTQTLKIGLIGLGKIAVDQHIPSIRANKNLELVAGASPGSRPQGVVAYNTLAEMLKAHPEIEAVAVCTPPQVRLKVAREVIDAGRHVFLEKPPAATIGEAELIRDLAKAKGVSALASWHSRYAPAVEATRKWMGERPIKSVHIVWKENVRQWHPGQTWIFEAGGMGVFDPGINSLSILTRIVRDTVIVKSADLHFPSNCQAPIQVEMNMQTDLGLPIRADYDFLQTGVQTWSIFVESEAGEKLTLSMGGTELEIDGKTIIKEKEAEYSGLYAHFYDLVKSGTSDVDLSPLRVVADAFMVGKRIEAPAYIE
jgi:D-galactose 1-dehydrogenase